MSKWCQIVNNTHFKGFFKDCKSVVGRLLGFESLSSHQQNTFWCFYFLCGAQPQLFVVGLLSQADSLPSGSLRSASLHFLARRQWLVGHFAKTCHRQLFLPQNALRSHQKNTFWCFYFLCGAQPQLFVVGLLSQADSLPSIISNKNIFILKKDINKQKRQKKVLLPTEHKAQINTLNKI